MVTLICIKHVSYFDFKILANYKKNQTHNNKFVWTIILLIDASNACLKQENI